MTSLRMKSGIWVGVVLIGCGFPPVFRGNEGSGEEPPFPVLSRPTQGSGGAPNIIASSGGSSAASGAPCTVSGEACAIGRYCDLSTGSPFCACSQGRGGPDCNNLATCEQLGCSDEAVCVELGNGAQCFCGPGYQGTYPNCGDVDECARSEDLCAESAQCHNTGGDYSCSCNQGEGDGFFCELDPCAASNCGAGTCQPSPGGYICQCPPGRGGPECEIDCGGSLDFSPALEASIRRQLNLPEGDLRASDLPEDGILVASASEIEDLSGLQCWGGLKQLVLRDNQIRDLEPLRGLVHLEYLDLSCNPLQSIGALGRLPYLRSLRFEFDAECPPIAFDSVEPIAQALNLEAALFQGVPIFDLGTFSALPHLRWLSVVDAGLESLAGLAPAPSLENLVLSNNRLEDLSDLADLKSLRTLELDENPISDITPLGQLHRLQTLLINDAQISDLSSLVPLERLSTLGLRNNQVSDLGDLARMTSLKSLDLGANPIVDFAPLVESDRFGWQGQLFIDGVAADCYRQKNAARLLSARGLNTAIDESCGYLD